jgi:hypothetical protein
LASHETSLHRHLGERAKRNSLHRRDERFVGPDGAARPKFDRRLHQEVWREQLIYYEYFETMPDAIQREKRLKEWKRAWKVRLILSMNPEWKNLFNPVTGEIAFAPSDMDRAGNRN